MEDIFRFMTVRPPDEPEPGTLQPVETEDSTSELQSRLEAALKEEEPRSALEREADEYVASDHYVKQVTDLGIPLAEIMAGLAAAVSPDRAALETITAQFTESSINDWVKSGPFLTGQRDLRDSLVARSIRDETDTVGYEELVQAIRTCALLGRVAAQDPGLKTADDVEAALNEVITLPATIFPLPPRKPRGGTSAEERVRLAEEASKKRQAVAQAQQRLQALNVALGEVLQVQGSAFREFDYSLETRVVTEAPADAEAGRGLFTWIGDLLRTAPVISPSVSIATDKRESPWVLSQQAINKLSPATTQLLQELDISLNPTPLPEAVELIEYEMASQAAIIYGDGKPGEARVIGETIFSDSDLADDLMVGGAPHPGTGSFRAIGVADLMVVKQEIQKYQLGEVAHIENALKGEFRERKHRSEQRTEETVSLETETLEEEEKDLQSTERFELKKEAAETLKEDHTLDASVTVKYGGVVDVTASTKYGYKNGSEESKSTAQSHAREVTSRAVSRVQEKVKKTKVTKTIKEVEENNLHRLDNTGTGKENIAGVYRWVDKQYEAQVFNYGSRLLFEFIVPEPAAFTIRAPQLVTPEGSSLDKPDPFTLKANDITAQNYLWWARKYGATDVEPPPDELKTTSKAFDALAQDEKSSHMTKSAEIPIPKGYKAMSGFARMDFNYWRKGAGITMAVGQKASSNVGAQQAGRGWHFSLDNEIGTIPLTVKTWATRVYAVSVEILCKLTERAREAWRIETHAKITRAYENLKADYEADLAAKQTQQGIGITGSNPKLNRQSEKTELKKGAIVLLTRKTSPHLEGAGSVVRDNNDGYGGYPEIDFAEIDREAPYIQFLEQAFEWDQIMYWFYSYFWGRKKRWPLLQQIQDKDPLHAEFLQAGAARVLVPVRPAYEKSVLYYLDTGKIWRGAGPPSVNSKLYVSLVKLIKQKQQADYTTGAGILAVTNKSKVVKGTGSAFSQDDVDRIIFIRKRKYRIAKVSSATRLTLSETYTGQSESGCGYALGEKYVGEPWDVTIPTTLVMLQKDSDLPDFTGA